MEREERTDKPDIKELIKQTMLFFIPALFLIFATSAITIFAKTIH